MWKVREIYDKATNIVMNYTEVEAKVREATNDEQWGPTGKQMTELAQHTFTYEHFPEVMGMLWKRMLQEGTYNWRRVYKSLLLLNYLVTNGSERVVTSAREHIYDLRRLENYTHVDEFGKDQGVNVRHKAKLLIDLIQNDEKIRMERKKAKQYKDKFIGVSNDTSSFRDTWSDHPNRKSESYDSSFNDDVKSDYEEKSRKADEFEKRADFESNVAENTVEQRKVPPPPPPQASNNALRPKVRAEPKKIDLGAAALYAKQHQPDNSRAAPSSSNKDHNTDLIGIDASASSTNGLSASGNLLTDLFGELTVKPTADIFGGPTASTATSNGNHADNFADFSQFDSANSNADDFTDFQSAFASPASASGASSLLNSDSSHPFSSNANSFAAMNPFMSQPQAPNNTASQLIMPQLLSPTPLVPVSSVGNLPKNNTADECTPATSAPHKIGDTWSNLKINMNFDNILDTKSAKPSVPTINQLANSSPPGLVPSPKVAASSNLFDQFGSLAPKSNPTSPINNNPPNSADSSWVNQNNSLI